MRASTCGQSFKLKTAFEQFSTESLQSCNVQIILTNFLQSGACHGLHPSCQVPNQPPHQHTNSQCGPGLSHHYFTGTGLLVVWDFCRLQTTNFKTCALKIEMWMLYILYILRLSVALQALPWYRVVFPVFPNLFLLDPVSWWYKAGDQVQPHAHCIWHQELYQPVSLHCIPFIRIPIL